MRPFQILTGVLAFIVANNVSARPETLTKFLTSLRSTENATADCTTETLTVSTETSAAVPERTTNADCDGATPFHDLETCVSTNPKVPNAPTPSYQTLNRGVDPYSGTYVTSIANSILYHYSPSTHESIQKRPRVICETLLHSMCGDLQVVTCGRISMAFG
ncbi:hypothetical protein BFJ63_vAg5912 [Fusarium oxysporum f. sp. narcissi]|uniref:Uncharacterized protein n=2 Tax=Fusarium oxysporum TaxID=5507 RepID=A0A420QBJ0_FUSOX|nr:hypothetical protein BFJ68_g12044 [Fusarium oxysporum]RYC91324.1 hypothetical protein BFJ63_vAg5912 [Fusarium oxysporum f. sp. narcissi]